MTASVGYGPLVRIDGPLPIPPEQGLLATAAAPAAGVQIVPEANDRWMNGAEVYPYPTSSGAHFDVCAVGSDPATKDFGDQVPLPRFGAFVVYLSETCTSYKVWDQDAFKARAVAALTAVESSLVSKQLKYGAAIKANPYLADGNGTFPNGDTVTSPLNGLELLEREIAKHGRQGVVHVTPMLATRLMGNGFALSDKSGAIRTINGVVVIPDFGYEANVTPAQPVGTIAHTAPSGAQEWAFATGPVDIRRSEVFTLPDRVEQAVDRGTGGATNGLPNSITYRAERYYLVDWDTAVQASVLIDRCSSTC